MLAPKWYRRCYCTSCWYENVCILQKNL